jgi:hypothetical protein
LGWRSQLKAVRSMEGLGQRRLPNNIEEFLALERCKHFAETYAYFALLAACTGLYDALLACHEHIA